MPEPAKRVTLDLERQTVFVNGGEFPWRTVENSTVIGLPDRGGLYSVTITFLTEHIEIIPKKSQEVIPLAATMSAHIQVGEPTFVGQCPHCTCCRLYRFPLTALLPTGVQQVGPITLCADCDSPARVVREHIVAEGWG